MRSPENQAQTALERLQSNLSFFIDAADAAEASEGILYLLALADTGEISADQHRALYHTLSVLNAIQRVQHEHVECKLKVA